MTQLSTEGQKDKQRSREQYTEN